MYTGTLLFDLLLPSDSQSLKDKRSYVRPIVAALRRYEVSVAEVGLMDRHGRAEIGVAVVGAEASHVREVLDTCERAVAGRPRSSCCRCGEGCTAATRAPPLGNV